MGRYARAVYGDAKYGLDLWSEHSVEPTVAAIEVDPHFSHTSSFTDESGQSAFNRVQVSWLAPSDVDRFVLLRSNLGYPTSPVDPFSVTLVDAPLPLTEEDHGVVRVRGLNRDPYGRDRYGYLDKNVEPGRECFYAIWVYVAKIDEWILAGRAMATTSQDHGTLRSLKDSLPPWMWNRNAGPGDGVATLDDDDDENFMTRWLQACSWELDKVLTKVDLLRNVWDPQITPAVLLDEAVGMYGLPVEPALGTRSQRALLANAADITGGRGSLLATSLLVESLTGYTCSITVGTNRICSTDESSFEGLTVQPGTTKVTAGTGRWHFMNGKLTRVAGDLSNTEVNIARDANSDDDFGTPQTRYGLRVDSVDPSKAIQMTLGDHIKVTRFTSDTQFARVTTKWVHGLEVGDQVRLTLSPDSANHALTIVEILDNFTVRCWFPKELVNRDVSPSEGYLHGGMIPVYQGVPVEPKTIYSLVGTFQAQNASNIKLQVKYYDQFGKYIKTATATPDGAVGPGPGWTQAYLADASPEGARAATLVISQDATGASQYLCVDSLMVKPGGTPYGADLSYSTATPYEGTFDYTYEDAKLVTINVDTTKTPSKSPVPFTVQADMSAVIVSRLTDILAAYLPVGTAFRIKGLPGLN